MPDPGPGVCRVCRGPASGGRTVCFACGLVARRLGVLLAPVVPARLCPLPGPLYTVLLGYKESPVDEARLRFAGIVRTLVHGFLLGQADLLEAALGGPIDLVTVVPSTRRPGPAPLARVPGIGIVAATALPTARWAPGLLCRAVVHDGSPPVAHMRPDPAAFTLPPANHDAVRGSRVLVLDDTYVSGARSQSAAAALHRAGARTVIGPLGRVLRPDRVPGHAAFLARQSV